jgi:hypothetical protein
MTTEKEEQVIRVCGENYQESDVPAIWRKKEEAKRLAKGAEIEDREDERFDYHPRPEEVN